MRGRADYLGSAAQQSGKWVLKLWLSKNVLVKSGRTSRCRKQDFVTFSLLLDKNKKKKLQEASGHIDAAARRSRVINKRLDGRKDEEDTLEWQEEVLHERE